MSHINLRGIFCFVSFLICFGFAQETHNLEIIWVKTASPDVWYLGSQLSSGDFNDDSFADIVISGDSLHGDTWTHKAYIFFGGPQFDTIPDIVIVKGFIRLKGIGDINDDGFDDLALGSPNSPFGRVYIYLGGDPMDTICDFEMKSSYDASSFGEAIGSGDINGDNCTDLIIGAYRDMLRPGFFPGRVYIYFGGSNFDTLPDVILNGGHNNDQEGFGSDIGKCADVNNNGYEDAIIGAWDYGASQGRLYIYLGGNPMDTIYDIAMIGEGPNQHLGWGAVSSLKNANDFDYAMIGTSLWPRGFPSIGNGKIYVLFGGNPMDSTPDVCMIGRTDTSGLGNSIASAGDINGDSCDDIIAGASWEYNGNGAAYIWLGGNLLDTIPDAWIKGTPNIGAIGDAVTSAGDIDDDEKDEIMVSNYAAAISPNKVWVCKYTEPGIEECLTQNAKRLMLEINPNPAKSVIRVRGPFPERTIKIFDVSGKFIKEVKNVTSAQEHKKEIKVSLKGIHPGVYFLRLGKETKKFLVVK